MTKVVMVVVCAVVCVCACVLGHVSAHPRIVFAWAVDCVWFTGLGCFNVALSVWVFSYRG